MSTFFSFVLSFRASFVRSRIVCKLSYRIVGFSFYKSKFIALNSRFYYISSFAVVDRAKSSASVLDIVTVRCFVALKYIIPPKSYKQKLLKLYRVALSSANAESLYIRKTFLGRIRELGSVFLLRIR